MPGETTRRVRFVAQLPPGLETGEYRAVLFTENLVETVTQEGLNVLLKTRIGATIYIRNGDISSALSLTNANFNAESNQLELLVGNTGEASVRPEVIWRISRADEELANGKSDPTSIVAGTDRYIPLGIPGEELPELSPGDYVLNGELRWEEHDETLSLPFEVALSVPVNLASIPTE